MDFCPVCQEPYTNQSDIVIVKHRGDRDLSESKQRGHFFHAICLNQWREQCRKQDNNAICPLDRDPISRIYRIPNYELLGFDLGIYNHDYRNLITSIKINHSLLKQLAQNGIDEVDCNNKTLAYYACEYGNYNLVCKLLKYRAQFQKSNGFNGFTPLMVAICKNYTEIAKKLLCNTEVLANIYYTDNYGMSAFYYACKFIRYNIAIEFLSRKIPTSHHVRYVLNTYRTDIEQDTLYGRDLIHLMLHYLKNTV